ncbi:helix-turn-helix transcriptional regulator [Paenibacillus sp. SI8]|uniref:helix-turn-helix transcriptional regulator n=1 Tax=unclassified Paenibacillus TaxID=185978 RepID=UPI003465A815
MALIAFTVPPLPHYIISGSNTIPKGGSHPSRHNIQVFDLLVTTNGCFYIGEDDNHFEVSAGHAVILRPDRYHFAMQKCAQDTDTHWLHFHAGGTWAMVDDTLPHTSFEESAHKPIQPFAVEPFTIRIPQFTRLLQPDKTYDLLEQLHQLHPRAHVNGIRWTQQQLFQDLLRQLSASIETEGHSPWTAPAEKAASYLRQHYRRAVTAKELGESVNFHPVYIARCMQKEYGCSPTEYVNKIRIQQAKLLLLQTDLPIARIAEEVGFEQPAYFATCFTKLEGISPRQYRQRFSHG